MSMLRPKRDVVDVVVAKLPPPDRLGKSDGGRDAAYDEDDQGGEGSAVEDFAEALGVRMKDRGAAVAALRDFVAMCIEKHMESASTDEE